MYCGKGPLLQQLPPTEANQTTERAPYRLELLAAHCNGALLDRVDQELGVIMDRLYELEAGITCQETEQGILDLKKRINTLRSALEVARAVGFWKDTPVPRNPSRPYWNRIQSRRKTDLEKQQACQKFMQICEMRLSEEVRRCLRMPTFDNWQWEDEEILLLLQHMYIDLEFPQKLGIDLAVLRRFLCQVYMNYHEVPFHNFHHCFCVTQMMYGIIWAVQLPSKIGDLETLVLLTSCICHDLDHPGFNNIYQINARTELALRYNDISPLENHHCSVAFRILEDPSANLFRDFAPEMFRKVREGMIRCILATDMARHNEILGQFLDIISTFDYSNRAHINQLCMVLIKVADISNEARPMDVAEPWLDCLLQEFFQQSDTEKLLGLPVTPFMDRDKITKPSSQCSFIGFVLLPLFEAIGQLIPELEDLIVRPVREALEYYRRLNEASKDTRQRRSIESNTSDSTTKESPSISMSPLPTVASTRSPLLPPPMNPEPSSEEGSDSEANTSDEELDLKEALGLDPDTTTEVDVSEQTLTFKIHSEPWPVSSNHGHRRHSLLSHTRRASKELLHLHKHHVPQVCIQEETDTPTVNTESLQLTEPPSAPNDVVRTIDTTVGVVTKCSGDTPFLKRIKHLKERLAGGGGRRTRVTSSIVTCSNPEHHPNITSKRVLPNLPRFFRRSFSRTDKSTSPALSSSPMSTPTHSHARDRKLSGSLDTLLEPNRR